MTFCRSNHPKAQLFQCFAPIPMNHVAVQRSFAMSSGHLITIRKEIRGCPKTGLNDRFDRPNTTTISGKTRSRIPSGHAHRTYRYGVLSGCPVLNVRLVLADRRWHPAYIAAFAAGVTLPPMPRPIGGNAPIGCACLIWCADPRMHFIVFIGLFRMSAYNAHYGKSMVRCSMIANPLILLGHPHRLTLTLILKKIFDGVGRVFLLTPRTNGPTLPYYDFFSCPHPYIDCNLHKA